MASGLNAIILAAGLSTRMGAFKPLLPLGSTTVLGQCIDLLRQAGVQRIVVVSGHRAGELAAEALRHGIQPVYNPDFLQGMYTSIRAGMQAVDAGASGVFLLPVDIPLIRVGTLALLAQELHEDTVQVVHPAFDGERGHPLFIRAPLLRQLTKAATAPEGLRPLLALHEDMHPHRIRTVAVADANILFDLDTPEAYGRAQELLDRRDYPSPEEAAVIVRHIHPMPAKGLAHGRQVGALAGNFAAAINRAQKSRLDVELCRTCGLLHDLAKGHVRHEELGGVWLRRLGFPRAAVIVAAHKDLDWQEGMPVTERELVHLADKLVHGSRVVSLQERFEEKLTLYAHDAAAQAAIGERYDLARRLARAVEAASGQSLAALCGKRVLPFSC